MKKKELSDEQQNAKNDLKTILLTTLIPVMIYLIFGNNIMNFTKTSNFNVWIKCLPIILVQFGMSGLGLLVVIFHRKEKLRKYGFVKENLLITIILSVLVHSAFHFSIAEQ